MPSENTEVDEKRIDAECNAERLQGNAPLPEEIGKWRRRRFSAQGFVWFISYNFLPANWRLEISNVPTSNRPNRLEGVVIGRKNGEGGEELYCEYVGTGEKSFRSSVFDAAVEFMKEHQTEEDIMAFVQEGEC